MRNQLLFPSTRVLVRSLALAAVVVIPLARYSVSPSRAVRSSSLLVHGPRTTAQRATTSSPNSAYGWGAGDSGQLGNGSTTDQHTPVPVADTTPPLVKISASGDFTVALATDGTAWAWGANNSGQLGDGTSNPSNVPVAVLMPTGVSFTDVATGEGGCCGGHVIALDTTGKAWAWGADDYGDNGTGTASNQPVAVTVNVPTGVTFKSVAAGPDQSYAVGADGSIYGWGDNGDGSLNAPGGVNFDTVAAGWDYGIGVDTSGNAWGWGVDDEYQLGTGGTGPGAVVMPSGVKFASVSASHFGAGSGFTLALTDSGNAYAWGYNGDGELGDNSNTNRNAPVAVAMPSGVTFVSVSAGGDFSLALDSTGRVWSWGANERGQLGDGTTEPHLIPEVLSQPADIAFGAIGAGSLHAIATAPSGGAARGKQYGVVLHGSPHVRGEWKIPFQAPHTYNYGEPTSCFTPPGCNLGLTAKVRWGDGTSSSSASRILCTMQPPPGPAPGPPPGTIMQCNAEVRHDFTAAGAYGVSLRVSVNGIIVVNEAQIRWKPTPMEIHKNYGELVAYDTKTGLFTPCTATVVSSVTENIIVTATHCVADILKGNGHVFAHFEFAPGKRDFTCVQLSACGKASMGVWYASGGDVTLAPIVAGHAGHCSVGTQCPDQRYDWAFIVMHRSDGKSLESVTGGGLKLEFNPGYGQGFTVLGLPHGKETKKGSGVYPISLKSCSGQGDDAPDDVPPPGPDPFHINSNRCNQLTEGASGGPWLNSNDSVGAVNKACCPGIVGTYLSDDARVAFLRASKL